MSIEVAGNSSSETCQKSALNCTRRTCSWEVLLVVICYNTTQIEVPGGAVGNWVLLAAMQFKSQILEKLLSLQELARDTLQPSCQNQGARVSCWSLLCCWCKNCRICAVGELEALMGKPCMLWNLAKWAHQSQKQKSFLLGLIAHGYSPLTHFHCQLAKKKTLKGSNTFYQSRQRVNLGQRSNKLITNIHLSKKWK